MSRDTGQLLLHAHAQGALSILHPCHLPQQLFESLIAAIDEQAVRDAILGQNANVVKVSSGTNEPPVSVVLALLETLLLEGAAGGRCDGRLPVVILGAVERLLEELFPALDSTAEGNDKGECPEYHPEYAAWTICRLLKVLASYPALGEAEAQKFSAILRSYGARLANAAFKQHGEKARMLELIVRAFLSNPAVPLCVAEEWLEPISLLRWAAQVVLDKQVLAEYPPELACTMLKASYMPNPFIAAIVMGVLEGFLKRKLPGDVLARVLLTATVLFQGDAPGRRIVDAISDSPNLTPEMLSILVTATSYFDDSSFLHHVPSRVLTNPALPKPVIEAVIAEAMSVPANDPKKTRWAMDVLDMLAKNPGVSDEDLAAACLSSNSKVAGHARELLAKRSGTSDSAKC